MYCMYIHTYTHRKSNWLVWVRPESVRRVEQSMARSFTSERSFPGLPSRNKTG